MSTLLSREAFTAAVFKRDKGRCVLCARSGAGSIHGQKAVDAHHILERKLFEDGGYRLKNGASVCESHHWDCETTRISVEEVRAACGLNNQADWVLPLGFGVEEKCDKWGNRFLKGDLHLYRIWGPLKDDLGARRALTKGGFIHLILPADHQIGE
jgi:hypothetical protein